ncbi:Nitrogen permease regulator 3-like protein [Tribolium castaneum]|uniref:GATOR complex protein NPRL3 n=1 Tax=Tribolium castaneum TaxID=7070 RepID=D6X2A2_TRICA|nr:PREDICTED: nitrogen permease regulator 3-like protein [Tribolium castaneum]EFA09890.1 Nitrogen permease regulator 3-like protein [Tribolium castaneum]|eukprot:XP_970617.1 PREDICTED: nitrogen permease regulator 3-like protein [Tribolium castaneum]
MEVNPLSVILVKSDSKGDRLLFRYPFRFLEKNEPANTKRRNPYTLPNLEDLLQSPTQPTSNINKGHLTGFTDEVLSSLFAVKSELCNNKFELKVNDVRFVGHPTLLQLRNKQQDASGLMLINVVFALQALASHSVVTCYHDLSKRVGIALRYEEKRCGYVSEQTQTMTTAHDDGYTGNSESAFETILTKCTLAKNIKKLYEDLCSTGLVNIQINKWITLSFCLPQKVHQWHLRGKFVEPKDIDRCLKALRPYHSLLLLHPIQQMADFTGLDGSPSLERMLKQYSPIKNLQTLAADADLTLHHVFELTAHLVYWAKATVIFPICLTNKYVIAPDAPIHLNSPLIDKFSEAFPTANLIRVISDFALPTSLGQKCNPLCHPAQQSHLVQTIIWMLQHHLLLQLHTYVQYMPTDHGLAVPREKDERLVSQRNIGNVLSSSSYHPSTSEHSRAESESGTSTVSETPELRSESDLINRSINLENVSFTSVEDEKQDYQEELLLDFPDEERGNIFKIPATNNPEDLRLFARLCRKGYFHGNHHIEEIMYLENLRRSQLLQLLDKFRDVLITYETEDPAIAMFSYT